MPHQPFLTFALIGPLTPEELHSSAASLRLHLTQEEVQWPNLERETR